MEKQHNSRSEKFQAAGIVYLQIEDVKAFEDDNLIDFITVGDADHRFTAPKKIDLAIAEVIKRFSFN